ncbi:MAG: hypothetical protein M0R51_05185 [Clostridia bacterium]|jgi:hypothetical protein|nr:hypothetical protein [Clostridia bacterium]
MVSVNDRKKAAGTGGGKRSAPGATYSRNKTVGKDTTPQVERAYNNLSSVQKQASSSLGLTKAQALQLNERQAANVNNNINKYSEAQKAQLRTMYSNVTNDRAARSGSSGLNKIELQQYKQEQAQKSFGSVSTSGKGVTVKQAPKFIQKGSTDSRVSSLQKFNSKTQKWEIPTSTLNNLEGSVKTQGDYNLVSGVASKTLYDSANSAEKQRILTARNYIVNHCKDSYQADQYKKYYHKLEIQAQYDRAYAVAGTPITLGTSASEKKRIQTARAWLIAKYPEESSDGKTTQAKAAAHFKSLDSNTVSGVPYTQKYQQYLAEKGLKDTASEDTAKAANSFKTSNLAVFSNPADVNKSNQLAKDFSSLVVSSTALKNISLTDYSYTKTKVESSIFDFLKEFREEPTVTKLVNKRGYSESEAKAYMKVYNEQKDIIPKTLSKADAYVLSLIPKSKPITIENLMKYRGYSEADAKKFMTVYEKQNKPLSEKLESVKYTGDNKAALELIKDVKTVTKGMSTEINIIKSATAFGGAYVASNAASAAAHPVTSAYKVAVETAKFAVAAALIEGVVAVSGAELAVAATKVSKPILSRALLGASKGVSPAVKGFMGVGIGVEGVKTAVSGDFERQKSFLNELVIGGYGYSKGNKVFSIAKNGSVSDVVTLVPGVKKAGFTELVGKGSDSSPVDFNYGYSVSVAGQPVVSVRTVGGLGFKVGAISAPESILKGKTTQSFSKVETAYFMETIKYTNPFDELYLKSGLNLSDAIYNTKKPLYTPKTFKATSTAIPERWQAAVEHATKNYEGALEVAGSVPMKAQANGYVTRATHDVEYYVEKPADFAAYVRKILLKDGAIEGKDFKLVSGVSPKIKFYLGKDEGFDTGIEIFRHGTESPSSSSGVYSSEKGELAFGYKSKSMPKTSVRKSTGTVKELKEITADYIKELRNIDQPLKAGTAKEGYISQQKASEQFVRKMAGSTMLKESELMGGKLGLQPAHSGRLKDVGDVVTVATAFISEGRINKSHAKDLINFVNAANKKFGDSQKFKDDVLSDPVYKYILANQKVPTKEVLSKLTDLKISESTLLFKKTVEALNLKTAEKLKIESMRKGQSSLKKSPSPQARTRSRSKTSPSPVSRSKSKTSPSPKPTNKSKTSPSPSQKPTKPKTTSRISPSPKSNIKRKSGSPSPKSGSPSPKKITASSPSPAPRRKTSKKSASSTTTVRTITPKEVLPLVTSKKRKTHEQRLLKSVYALRGKRVIKNKLGSFDSILGSSSKPTKKRKTSSK